MSSLIFLPAKKYLFYNNVCLQLFFKEGQKLFDIFEGVIIKQRNILYGKKSYREIKDTCLGFFPPIADFCVSPGKSGSFSLGLPSL